MREKTQKEYVDHGLGFPVVLRDVSFLEIRGEWVPDIDYRRLDTAVLVALAVKHSRLTGHEVRFIRLHFEMKRQQFADLFGLSRQATKKWEDKGDNVTDMNWSAEKVLRLFVAARLGIVDGIIACLDFLREPPKGRKRRVRIAPELMAITSPENLLRLMLGAEQPSYTPASRLFESASSSDAQRETASFPEQRWGNAGQWNLPNRKDDAKAELAAAA